LLSHRDPSADVGRLREDLAFRLGRGLAGLVNATDPDLVTLGSLAGPVRDAAPDRFAAAYDAGLMTLHRERPPLLTAATAGDNAVLAGVGLTALDQALDAARLAGWVASR
jgi:predicted NBD/HSP70 family sugar kinase